MTIGSEDIRIERTRIRLTDAVLVQATVSRFLK